MPFSNHYDIRLPFVKAGANSHAAEAPEGAPFEVLGPRSPFRWRMAAEKLAYYFRREFRYDFPPYKASESKNGAVDCFHDRVLLFHKPDLAASIQGLTYFFGAVGVRWMVWEDFPACWCLGWAWLHPYERRRGHLTNAWPYILKMFPNPSLSYPVSAAMEAFLKKVGYSDPLKKPAKFVVSAAVNTKPPPPALRAGARRRVSP
jgi:hypothetical protein